MPDGTTPSEIGSEKQSNLPIETNEHQAIGSRDRLATLSNEDAALLRRLPALGRLDPVRPAWATDAELQRLAAVVERTLTPIGREGVVVLLDRLFAVLPLPPTTEGVPDPLAIYVDRLEQYPADVLARAVDEVIDTHKWNTPPKPAAIVIAAKSDAEYSRRRQWLAQIHTVAAKPIEIPRPVLSPTARELEKRRKAAMLEAADRNRAAAAESRHRAIAEAFERASESFTKLARRA